MRPAAICEEFPFTRRAGILGEPHPLRASKRAIAETSRTKRQSNSLPVMRARFAMYGGEDCKMQNPLERIGFKAD
jgi:hypothetical protein